MPHGKMDIQHQVSSTAPEQLNLPPVNSSVSTTVSALADTNAQMCVADWQIAKRLGLKKDDLFAPALSILVADNSSLELIGAHFLRLSDTSSETTEQLVYFATGVGEFDLSQTALKELNVIPHDFPTAGSYRNADDQVEDVFEPPKLGAVHNEVHGEFSPELLRPQPDHRRQGQLGKLVPQHPQVHPRAGVGSPMPMGFEPPL